MLLKYPGKQGTFYDIKRVGVIQTTFSYGELVQSFSKNPGKQGTFYDMKKVGVTQTIFGH